MPDEPITPDPPTPFWRPLLVGVLLLGGMVGAVWMMKVVSQSAYLVIEANEQTAVLLETEAVSILSEDGKLAQVVRTGSQSAKPGRYRFQEDSDEFDLDISIDQPFDLVAGERLVVTVTATLREE